MSVPSVAMVLSSVSVIDEDLGSSADVVTGDIASFGSITFEFASEETEQVSYTEIKKSIYRVT